MRRAPPACSFRATGIGRRWSILPLLALALAAGAAPPPVAPEAKRVPHVMRAHGHTRVDDYYWLRDDRRSDPDVLAYLTAENDYLAAALAHTEPLQEQLIEEMRARIAPDWETAPVRQGRYWYYQRYRQELDYPLWLRRAVAPGASEELILDLGRLASGRDYFNVVKRAFSRSGRYVALAVDQRGDENHTIYIKDLETGQMLPDVISGAAAALAWSHDERALFYLAQNSALRPYRVHRHTLGTATRDDRLYYEELDPRFFLDLYPARTHEHIILEGSHTLGSSISLLDTRAANAAFVPLVPARSNYHAQVDVVGELVYLRTDRDAPNYRIVRAPISAGSDTSQWQELVPERGDVFVQNFTVLRHHLVLEEVHDGVVRLQVLDLRNGNSRYVPVREEASSALLGQNLEWDTTTLRYVYTSLATPHQIYDLDLTTGSRMLRKSTFAGADFSSDRYRTQRLFISARDGEAIPVLLLSLAQAAPDGSQPLAVIAYGAYGEVLHPEFKAAYLSLVERGFTIAIAQIRGGQERGRRWYDAGRALNKTNSFNDFIDATRGLLALGWGDPRRVIGIGRSAGGLVIGAVANNPAAPFQVLVTEVPFVDVVTTMGDESIPLTSYEYDEWGDPGMPDQYSYMHAYSPYDQVRRQAYPHLMVSTGLWDGRVGYFEAAKWVAKLRTHKTDDHRLFLNTDVAAGHNGSLGRYRGLRLTALEYAFILDTLAARGTD